MKSLTEQIIHQTGTLVVVLDEKGQAEYVSPSSEEILGFLPEQLLGNGWITYTRSQEEARLLLDHLQLIRNGGAAPVSYERSLKTRHGGTKHILWNTKPSADGKVIGIGYDITDRKYNEQLLEQRSRELAERNKEMLSSLRYAQRIQEAILPSDRQLKKSYSDAFVLYKPKDIVSGDFWFHHETEHYVFTAAIDCTGHGVPGALMSVIAHSIFREVFLNKALTETDEILYELDKELFEALHREHSEHIYADGMDVALFRLDKQTRKAQFSGALRPAVLVRNQMITELQPGKFPLGVYNDVKKIFHKTEIQLDANDWIYLFSDGYADQFGGDNNKKLNKSRFRELLVTASEMNGDEQLSFLEYSHKNWRQDEEQTDDIIIIGIRT